jgi:CBS domain-containing protein
MLGAPLETMLVADLMTANVQRCRATDTLDRASGLMWDHDCGALPVVDDRGHTIGMITDRDICMAAYTQGKPLHCISVSVAASHTVQSVRPDELVEFAYAIMTMHRVRRLPVIDRGGNLVGIVSLADIVRQARQAPEADAPLSAYRVISMLAEVYRPSCPKTTAAHAGA